MTTSPTYGLPSTATIYRETLANGLTLLLYENQAVESVVMFGSLHAGSIYDPPGRAGIASMTAAGLLRGTHSRDFITLHSNLEDIGAEFDYTTGKHRVIFNGRALAEDLSILIDTLAETLREPVFAEDEIADERSKRLTELNYVEQDTRYIAGRIFRQALYPDHHPYHYATFGNLDSTPGILAHDLRDFHTQYYSPDGMIVVIVGAVEASEAARMVTEALGDWQAPTKARNHQLPAIPRLEQTLRVERDIPGKTQRDIVMGTLGPARTAPDFLAASLANSILGEFGMMGRVGNVIREQLGLAYYASSHIDGGEGSGAWSVVAGVAPDHVEMAIERAHAEIQRLVSEPVSAQDLEDNQAYFTGRLPLRLESNYGIAAIIHSMQRYQLGLDYLLTYRDHIYSLTTDDVMRAAQHYLDPNRLVIAVAG